MVYNHLANTSPIIVLSSTFFAILQLLDVVDDVGDSIFGGGGVGGGCGVAAVGCMCMRVYIFR